jgi:integrase
MVHAFLALETSFFLLPNTLYEIGSTPVRRSLTWAGGRGPRFFEPKTRSGRRVLKVAPELVRVLKVWKLACPPSDLQLVFPSPTGAPLHRTQLLRYGMTPALRKAGLRHVTVHSLRHSFASMLFGHGSPITEVSAILGHANPGVTLRIYSHFLKDLRTTASDQVAAVLLSQQQAAKTAS